MILGLFLLLAAVFKAHALATTPSSQDSLFSSPRLQIAAIEIELVLGLLLVLRVAPRLAWFGALCFFMTAASLSLYLALEGQASCGCFGSLLTVNPWLTFTLDSFIVLALLIWQAQAEPTTARWRPSAMQIGIAGLLFFVLIGGTLIGESLGAFALMRGERISIEPHVSDVGDGAPGEKRRFTILLQNHGNEAVRIIGGSMTCYCTATRDLPIVVAPGQSRGVEVEMVFRGTSGRFDQPFVLYTEDEQQPMLLARFRGRMRQR